jgi:hypothetical protein
MSTRPADQLYGYPDLMRAGLGNMLFPWARCVVWSDATGASILAPRWHKFRLGPYLRRESDKRRYDRLFRSSGYLRGPAKAAAFLRARNIDESAARSTDVDGPLIVRFSGLGDYFTPLIGEACVVGTELRRITRPRFLPELAPSAFIAVHVRLGDFSDALRQPLDWYRAAVVRIRSDLDDRPRVRLYSDGRADELRELTSLPDVELIQGRESITDMLDLAQASSIVASSSTFSMWGAFLGEVPTVWYPGRLWQTATHDPAIQIEWGGDVPLPSPFVSAVAGKLASDQPRPGDA